jgi:ketosteroid isomerase-like protein
MIRKVLLTITVILLSSCTSERNDMNKRTEKETVLKFVEAINNANIDELEKLMSDDHVFVDAGDGKYEGKENMKQAWITYFGMFPDYRIEVVEVTEGDSIVGIFGYASGTYKGLKNETNSNYFRTPAAWKAIVRDGKIKHWQVYCESKRTDEIVERNK